VGAGPDAGALPGHQIQGHLAGGGHQQHGQGEGGQPDEEAVEADRAVPAGRGGAYPVGEVDHHERQQQQPQGAAAVAGGEVAPDIRLLDWPVPGVFPALGVRSVLGVLGAAEDGGRVVARDPDGTRVAEHLLRSGPAHPVHQ
jgi:hypothetical protein